MRKLTIALLAVFALVSCGNRSGRTQAGEAVHAGTAVQAEPTGTVYVYYFHGKQRCKTCIAVGDVSEKTVKDAYAGNPKVKFMEVKTHEEANAPLVEKYEVTWNALIIAEGDDSIEITKQAFASAVNNPETLAELIKSEIDKRLAK